MARKPRIHYPGAVYHVILRGNAGGPVFFTDRDRYRFYLFLQYAVETFGCRIHGYCLMTNHIHLVMQAGEVSLSRIMQNVALRYTKWINYSQKRSGHVFQGRYKAVLVDADSYLLELVRYVHLNPVRAGLVETVESWRWSGHHAYLGAEYTPWLCTEWVLSMFSPRVEAAREEYQGYIREGIDEERRAEFHVGSWEGRLLGDDFFIDSALEKAGEEAKRSDITVADVVDATCAVYGCSMQQIQAAGKAYPFCEARAIASCIVQRCPNLQLTELGRKFHRGIASLGRVGRRLENQAAEEPRLLKLLDKVYELLNERQKG